MATQVIIEIVQKKKNLALFFSLRENPKKKETLAHQDL
jgi:hypothetical protein